MEEQETKTPKELKVENWAVYFLNRLRYLYTKGAHCDIVLQFSTMESLQVHRIVLQACTDYFDDLLKDSQVNTVHLNESMTPEAVAIVIGFMYSGKLELMAEMRDPVHYVAKEWKMAILLRLMESSISNTATPAVVPVTLSGTDSLSVGPTIQRTEPAQVLKPVVRNELPMMRRPNQKVAVLSRKVPGISIAHMALSGGFDGRYHVVLQKPIPTRLDWDKDLSNDLLLSPVGNGMRCLAHDTSLPCPQPIFVNEPPDEEMVKRFSNDQPDLHNMKEFGRQQQIRNELVLEEEDVDDPVESSPPVLISPKPILKPSHYEATDTPKKVRFLDVNEPRSTRFSDILVPSTPKVEPNDNTSDVKNDVNQSVADLQKDVETYHASATSGQLEVRVETTPNATSRQMEVRLESNTPSSTSGQLVLSRIPNDLSGMPTESVKRVRYSVLSADGKDHKLERKSDSVSVGNPAKIVSEVLRKYPDLVAGRRKNIKLKVFTNNLSSSLPLPEPKITVKMDPRVCTACGENVSDMTYHMLVKHGVDPPPGTSLPTCITCGHVSPDQAALNTHIESAHNRRELTCATCKVSFKSRVLYNNHLSSEWHKNRARDCDYPCPFCDVEFKAAEDLKMHVEAEHQKIEPTNEPDEKLDHCESNNISLKSNVENNQNILPDSIEESQMDCQQQMFDSQTTTSDDSANLHSQGDESSCLEIDESQVEDSGDSSQPHPRILYEHPDGTYRPFRPELDPSEQIISPKHEVMEQINYSVQNVNSHSELEYATGDGTDGGGEYAEQVNEVVYSGDDNSQRAVYSEVEESGVVYTEGDVVVPSGVVYSEGDVVVQTGMEYPANGESSQAGLVYEVAAGEAAVQEFKSEKQLDDGYQVEPGHHHQEAYQANQDPGIDQVAQMVAVDEEGNTCEGMQEDSRTEQRRDGDHDYAPYNSVVMVQPSVPAIANMGGLMLLTHPLQVLISGPMAIPYPECGPVQVVNNAVNVSNEPMEIEDHVVSVDGEEDASKSDPEPVDSDQQMECCIDPEAQLPRERKVEPATLVNDWEENSEVECCTIIPVSGSGPSRPEFF